MQLNWMFRRLSLLAVLLIVLAMFSGVVAAQDGGETLTIYSGRSEDLISPLLEQFSAATGVTIEVRYGSSAEMAATILEEGDNSPADVYISQDAGTLGALESAGRLHTLTSDVLERVPEQFSSNSGAWVGLSGRARALVYNTEFVTEDQLPASMVDLANPEWAGKVGWAPTNASFQTHITALRQVIGEDATRAWLEGMVANGTIPYEGNDAVLQAVITGEVQVGLVNHYYLLEFLSEDPNIPVQNYYFPAGDVGEFVNVAGVGVLNTSDTPALAERFVLYMLGADAQTYFRDQTFEYPLSAGVAPNDALPALDTLIMPEIDLSNLVDLQGTLDLLSSVGATP